MTSNQSHPSDARPRRVVAVDELFRTSPPVRSADDLAHDGIFDDDEVDEFLRDLYAMRGADTA